MNSYRFTVGNIKLMVISDGFENLDEAGLADIIKPLPDAFLEAFRASAQPYGFSYNILYVETAGERILVDTGNGPKDEFGGKLLDVLRQEGIAPEQIDKVIFSHLHRDHIGGLTVDGRAVFPNAKLIIPILEWEYWLESEDIPAARVELLNQTLQPYCGRICFVNDSDWVADGVTLIHLPGHTPGHSGFMIESGGQGLLHIADALHLSMQIASPHVSSEYDLHKEVAANTRRKVLDRIADEKLMALTYHLPFPGIAHVEHDGAGLLWKPLG